MRPLTLRPCTLKEVVDRVNGGHDSYWMAMAEFLDHFYSITNYGEKAASIAENPGLTSKSNQDHDWWQDAWIGGTAEHLARIYDLKIPPWVEDQERFLREAWYCNARMEPLKATFREESPLAFRRRLIFTEAEPLRRV